MSGWHKSMLLDVGCRTCTMFWSNGHALIQLCSILEKILDPYGHLTHMDRDARLWTGGRSSDMA
eukprot:673878-Amphidinium_carterae.1